MNRFTLLFITGVCFCNGLVAQDFIDKDSIFQRASTEQKNIFMVFSGSDWCANCIRFDKQILMNPDFQSFINSNVFYLNADFPQRKKQPLGLVAQNEALAERYNPNGVFPTLLLIAPNNKIIPLSYRQETAHQFIDKMKKALQSLKTND
ncbi:MAG: hypothetical protein JWN78_2291 [Bacteroidota bacterium]|nr:hypothetical protein [Bacteroidota bacterium]